MSRFVLPDVLVLAAGGVLGEAWMSGVLAGIEDAADVDFREVEHFVGTSAGSIVAARLSAGKPPRRPRGKASTLGDDAPEAAPASRGMLRRTASLAALTTAPLAPAALAIGAPAGARLRGLVLSRLPDRGLELRELRRDIAALGARFDGRLRVCTVDRASGRRVVFGRPRAPKASVADAVTASCSIPWVFQPVEIGGREYLDGGVWSLTNLDVAPAGRESDVLCLNPTASLGLALSSLYGFARAAVGAAAELEALALRARSARVRTIGPDAASAEHMGVNFMDHRPARVVHKAGYRQGLTLGGR